MTKLQSSKDIYTSFDREGYILIKNVFPKEEIRAKREEIIKKANNGNDILSIPGLNKFVLNSKIIFHLKSILNSKKLFYFGDSSIVNHDNIYETKRGFHTDARDDFGDPKRTTYPIIRMGVYFQDCKDFSGGLKIRQGSHKHFCFMTADKKEIRTSIKELSHFFKGKSRYTLSSFKLGKSINVPIEEGDVAIWNMRTHHSGMSYRLKSMPNISLYPQIEQFLPKKLFIEPQYGRNRVAIFSAFSSGDESNPYVKNYISLKYNRKQVAQIIENPIVSKKLNRIGIKVVDDKIKYFN